jgi:replicative DNA helicase
VSVAHEQARRSVPLHAEALPRAVDAETGLMDAALNNVAAREIALALPAGAITVQSYQPLLSLMQAEQDAGRGCDRIALVEAARALGQDADAIYETIQDVDGACADDQQADGYAKIIRERYEQRLVIQRVHATLELMVAKPADARATARRLVDGILDFAGDTATGYVQAGVALDEAYADAQARASGDRSAVIRTGVAAIDGEIVGGLEPGDLCTWVMVSGHGKTAAVALIALRAALEGTGVGFISAEMARRQIARRWASLMTGLPFAKLKAWELSSSEVSRATYAAGLVDRLPLYVDDLGTPSLAHVVTQARRLVQRHPEVRLLVVDYVTLVQGTANNTVEAYGQVIRAMKRLAKELGVAIIGLVQPDARGIERREADQQMPELADIAWSQEFRNQSDLIVTGYRPGESNRQRTGQRADDTVGHFVVRKSRNSVGGHWAWSWDGATMGYDGGCWGWFAAQYASATPRLEVMR